eukprot:2093611-Amphidinium_carterae.1
MPWKPQALQMLVQRYNTKTTSCNIDKVYYFATKKPLTTESRWRLLPATDLTTATIEASCDIVQHD